MMHINLLYIKINVSYRDKIVKQSCYFVKICEREFNKKHIGVNLFSLQLCVHEKRMTILCEKGTKFVSRCSGLHTGDSRSFDKSRKLMILLQNPNFTCIFKF